jgi:tellurite resistance protein TerA
VSALAEGANAPLSGNAVRVSVVGDVDLTALVLSGDGKVSGDADMVFFNQPSAPGVALAGRVLELDLGALRAGAEKVVLVASPETAPDFSGTAVVVEVTSGSSALTFTPSRLSTESAVVLAEVYSRAGAWKVRAVGQGYADGLAGLARDFGVDVDDTSAPEPVVEEVPAPSLSLSKIELTKAKPSISLTKGSGAAGGVMSANLNWRANQPGKVKDLDLAVMWESKNGQKGVIQALGGSFGRLDQLPYVALDDDDRTGAKTGGETIRINLDRFDEVKRLLVFAYGYDGTPDWSAAGAVVSVQPTSGPPIEMVLESGVGRSVALVMVSNENGEVKVERLNHFVEGTHEQIDQAYGWGMHWSRMSK